MNIALNFLILIAAGALILKTTELFVKGTVDIAAALHLPKIFIALFLVSLITTAPEFIVSVFSSYLGNAGMAVGNAVGSVICNTGVVLAAAIIIKDVTASRDDFNYKITFLLGVMLLLTYFVSDGLLGRKEAVVLLFLLVFFFWINFRLAMKHRKAQMAAISEPDKGGHILKKGLILFFLGGIGTVLLARYGLLNSGLNIANELKIPSIVIGLSLIALGTSLPELFTAIISSRDKHEEIALGNVLGANILNILFVLGCAALVRPLPIDKETLYFHLPVMIFITVVMFLMGVKNLNYNRPKGLILLGIYVVYLVVLFGFLYK